jgi:hypothetical protein
VDNHHPERLEELLRRYQASEANLRVFESPKESESAWEEEEEGGGEIP